MSISRLVAVAVVINTVTVQVITFAYRPALAYAALEAGAAPAFLGAMSAVFAVPALLLAIPAGRFVDVVGERIVGVVGALLIAVSLTIALLSTDSFLALLLATLVFGLAHLTCIVAQQTFLANHSREGRGDSVFGWYMLAGAIGQAAGPLLLLIPGGAATGSPFVGLLLLVCGGLALVMLLTAALLPLRPRRSAGAPRGGAWSGALHDLRRTGTIRALIAGGVALASIDITLVYWPALGAERGLSTGVISTMLAVRAGATMASRGLLGWSTARWGRRSVMTVTLGGAALSLGAVSLPLPLPGLLVAAALYGLGVGACQPITMAWLSSLARPDWRGSMLSLRLAGNRLAQSTVPAAAGLLAASAGSSGVMAVLAGLLGVSTWAGLAVPDTERG